MLKIYQIVFAPEYKHHIRAVITSLQDVKFTFILVLYILTVEFELHMEVISKRKLSSCLPLGSSRACQEFIAWFAL